MAGGALAQMLEQTLWGELDYLVIDMPPGTGDIQLTLSQKAKVSGAVIVTTPQDIALLDARKGIEMFRKVDVPVLGIIENMSVHICSECGHHEPIFGAQGGERISKDYGVPLLASLPLKLSIREQTDAGRPTVVAEPESAEAKLYMEAAAAVQAALAGQEDNGVRQFPEIKISDD
jgi:ATP-binding protein involved in chromosome partitioning